MESKKTMALTKVHVIYWKYFDGSSGGIVKAYAKPEAAQSDLKMLQENAESQRDFVLVEVELDTRGTREDGGEIWTPEREEMKIPVMLNHDIDKIVGFVRVQDGKLLVDFLPEEKITKEQAFEIFGGAALGIIGWTTENDNCYIHRARIIEFSLAYTQPVWEYEIRPAFETWCWVTDGKGVWIAKHAQIGAANGWTNENTWEDFDKSVIAWIPLDQPDIPAVIK